MRCPLWSLSTCVSWHGCLTFATGVDNSDDLRVQGYDEAHKTLSSMCQSFDFSLCNLAVSVPRLATLSLIS